MKEPKALYVAPLRDFSGYASASRDYVRALNDAGGISLVTRDLRYDGGKYRRNSFERRLAARSAQDVDIVIQQTTPNEMERKDGCFNVGVFCWETDQIPDMWVHQLNLMDLILVPCRENLLTVKKCGVLTPVEQIHYATDLDRFNRPLKPFSMPYANDHFKFLAICQYSKKKGVDPLLKAYFSEFNADEKVLLILKTYFGPSDKDEHRTQLRQIINVMKQAMRLKGYPPLQLIHEVMDFDEIDRLYRTADCYCLPSRGEGWGVPHFDALGFGLPAIAVKGTGPEEFITNECGWLVNSHPSPCVDMPHPHDFMYTAKDNWREPQVGDLKRCMREAYEMWTRRENTPDWDNKCIAAATRVKDFDAAVIGPKLRDTILKYYTMWRAAHG